AYLQCFHSPIHGLVGKTAGGGKPLPQPDDSREGVDDPEPAMAMRHGHEKAAIVRAQVERGEDGKFPPGLTAFHSWQRNRGRGYGHIFRRSGNRLLCSITAGLDKYLAATSSLAPLPPFGRQGLAFAASP